jgi:hypothetical protein
VGAGAARLAGEGAAAAAPDAGSAALAREVRELSGAIVELRAALARTPVAASEASRVAAAPAPAPLTGTVDVQAALQQLAAAIADIARRADAGVAVAMPVPDPQRRQRVTAWLNDEHVWSAHVLWTCQQVLDTYGPPDHVRIQDNGSERWEYDFGEQGTVSFTVHDGRVTNAWGG